MQKYFDSIVRGTPREDNLVIVQTLKESVGKRFNFLNYYKEIPVSYDATLVHVESDTAEFEVHEYQAKVINIEKRTLVRAPENGPFHEDFFGEVFYVNIARKKVILSRFGYARIKSGMRRYVRVSLDHAIDADLVVDVDILKGSIKDISLGGAAMKMVSSERLPVGLELNLFLKLPDLSGRSVIEVGLGATIIKVEGDSSPYSCIVEFHPDKHSQQQIAYYINQRQVQIIKELKELNT